METRVSKSKNEKQTAFVVLFSAVTMVLEIVFGLFTHSMALLADGIHMGSHVLAIGLFAGCRKDRSIRSIQKRYSLYPPIRAVSYCSFLPC